LCSPWRTSPDWGSRNRRFIFFLHVRFQLGLKIGPEALSLFFLLCFYGCNLVRHPFSGVLKLFDLIGQCRCFFFSGHVFQNSVVTNKELWAVGALDDFQNPPLVKAPTHQMALLNG